MASLREVKARIGAARLSMHEHNPFSCLAIFAVTLIAALPLRYDVYVQKETLTATSPLGNHIDLATFAFTPTVALQLGVVLFVLATFAFTLTAALQLGVVVFVNTRNGLICCSYKVECTMFMQRPGRLCKSIMVCRTGGCFCASNIAIQSMFIFVQGLRWRTGRQQGLRSCRRCRAWLFAS